MDLIDIAQTFVDRVSQGEEGWILDHLYAPTAVSVEGPGGDPDMVRTEGLEAIRAKHEWWTAQHEVHASQVTGPYLGAQSDVFVVRFNLDVTPQGGSRENMEEVGMFTVQDGKIVKEEFSYLVG